MVATTEKRAACENANFVIIATPTDYDPDKGFFDTSSVESTISEVLAINPDAVIIIKSTVPVGYTDIVRKEFGTQNITFSS